MSYLAKSAPLVLPKIAFEGLALVIPEFSTFRGGDVVPTL
jgi:hypothetical protein